MLSCTPYFRKPPEHGVNQLPLCIGPNVKNHPGQLSLGFTVGSHRSRFQMISQIDLEISRQIGVPSIFHPPIGSDLFLPAISAAEFLRRESPRTQDLCHCACFEGTLSLSSWHLHQHRRICCSKGLLIYIYMMLLGRMVDPSERKRRSLSVIVFISISIGDWGCTSPKKSLTRETQKNTRFKHSSSTRESHVGQMQQQKRGKNWWSATANSRYIPTGGISLHESWAAEIRRQLDGIRRLPLSVSWIWKGKSHTATVPF